MLLQKYPHLSLKVPGEPINTKTVRSEGRLQPLTNPTLNPSLIGFCRGLRSKEEVNFHHKGQRLLRVERPKIISGLSFSDVSELLVRRARTGCP